MKFSTQQNGSLKSLKRVGLVALAATSFLAISACSSPEQKLEKYTKEGLEFLEEGKMGRANVQLQNALKINEEHVPALEGLTEIAESRSDFQAMFGILQRITRLEPNNVEAQIKLAKLHLLGSDEASALEIADLVLEIDSQNPDALAVKSAVMLRLENTSEAVELAKQALAIKPTSQEAVTVLATERINASDYGAALKYLEDAIALDKSSAVLHLLRIQILSRLERNEEVRMAYGELIEEFPEEVAYRRLYASLLIGEDKLDQARNVLVEITEIKPRDVEAVVDVVRINYKIDGVEKARSVFQSYIDRHPNNVDLKFSFANFLRLEKDFEGSKAIYEALLGKKNKPETILRAKNELAAQSLLQGDRGTAEAYITEILEEDERNSDALTKQAGLNVNDGKLDEAVLNLRSVLDNDPDNVPAKMLLATAFEQKGDVSFAESQMSQAVETSGFNPQTSSLFARFLMRQGNIERAEEVLAQSLAAFPSNVENLKFLAALRLRQQNWQGAEEVAEVLNEVGNQDPIVSRILGAAYAGVQDFTGAIDVLSKENLRAPLASRPLATLVTAYLRSDRAAEAEVLLETTIKEDPTNYAAYLLLSQVHRSMGFSEEAKQDLKKAIDEDATRSEAYEGLYQIMRLEGDRKGALALLDEGLENVPSSDALRVLKADLLIVDGAKEEALGIYEDILSRRPEDVLVSNNYASLLSELRDDDESIRKAVEAAKVLEGSESGFFLDTLGWAQFRAGESEKAISNLRKAVRATPTLTDAKYHLGIALLETGSVEQGRAELEKVVAAEGANPDQVNDARLRLGQ